MKKPVIAALFLLSVVVAACQSIESGDIQTGAMTAVIEVRPRRDGSATDVTASLTAGAFTFVDLDGEDRLVAHSGEVSVELQQSDLLGAVNYAGALEGIHAPGDVVTVALVRGEGKDGAPSSTVRLPEPVTLTAPAPGTSFSRENDDIVATIESAASEDPVRLSFRGECIEEGGLDVPAGQTTVTIAKGSIAKKTSADAADATQVPDTCTITLTVSRRIEGTLDPAFEGGSIAAVTSSSIDLTSTP